MSDLTAKQARFVEEYLLDLNATQAAIRAGYAESGASVEGARLLANAKIGEAVAAGLKARSERTQIDADWVLKRLADEATADIADLYDDNGNLLPPKEWPLIWRQGLVSGFDSEELFEGRGEERTRVGTLRKVKLSDRIRRIELIGKHVGVQAFREKVSLENPDGSALDNTPDRELAKAVAYVLQKGLKA